MGFPSSTREICAPDRAADMSFARDHGVRTVAEHVIGSVYTPPGLAEWTATQLLRHMSGGSVLRILDPACGDGELLASVERVSGQAVELCGRDVDVAAIDAASRRIKSPANFAVADSLEKESLDWLEWEPDGVIINPPWGNPGKYTRDQLQAAGYQLAKGQFDLYEVFVERLVKAFPNVPMAFILPDSLFLPEHARLRRFLLENTEILFLARLGEGLFPGVYRGTVVMVLRSRAAKGGEVECFRLRPQQRKSFLTEGASLESMRQAQSYVIQRDRFLSNPNFEFTLDVRPDESAIDQMLAKRGGDWSEWLLMGRGVEIGKSGKTLLCDRCGMYQAAPRKDFVSPTNCRSCGATFPTGSRIFQMIRHQKLSDEPLWNPIIVGEDVDRYRCKPSREVLIGLPGIRYKDPRLMQRPKLLVRKTGVGLRAAVDRSGSLTIQTVYHFIPKGEVPDLALDYMAGVLNSKAMLAFHLRWSGENEWRSHPYVTPTTIKTLPVPTPFKDGNTLTDHALGIATLARRRANADEVEEQIESLVQDLFGLTRREREWVCEVIESAQSLRGIAEMRT